MKTLSRFVHRTSRAVLSLKKYPETVRIAFLCAMLSSSVLLALCSTVKNGSFIALALFANSLALGLQLGVICVSMELGRLKRSLFPMIGRGPLYFLWGAQDKRVLKMNYKQMRDANIN